MTPGGGRTVGRLTRPLRFGDEVREGQLLAVLWSTALGEKKSEYVDALSQLRLERETLRRQETLLKDQAVPERNVREAMRTVEAAEIAVNRVERTLRSWRLTDAEIEDIRAEADQIHSRDGARDRARERSWARLEVRAPFGGTIVEKNVAVGDIVETTTDVFKIADLHRLGVWAHVDEEDLPFLLAMPAPIRWTIRVKSDPGVAPLEDTIEEIGDIIDPSQHTALVVGHVEQPAGPDARRAVHHGDGRTAAGPRRSRDPDLRRGRGRGGECRLRPARPAPAVVFTATRVDHPPLAEVAYVRGVPAPGKARTAGREENAPEPGAGGPGKLRPGEWVVTSGALLLRAALKDLAAAFRSKE